MAIDLRLPMRQCSTGTWLEVGYNHPIGGHNPELLSRWIESKYFLGRRPSALFDLQRLRSLHESLCPRLILGLRHHAEVVVM